MLQQGQKYPSDLTDQQWEIIKDWLPRARPGGRPRSTNIRFVVNGIFYLIRTGCAWRYLPKEFPPWRTVYDYYFNWQRRGIIETLHWILAQKVRVHESRDPYPSKIILDSQAAKAQFGKDRGYDGFKKVRGRKRNIVVDTLGMVQHLKVDAAKIKDHTSANQMFLENPQFIKSQFKNTTELLVDGGYRSEEFYLTVVKNYSIKLNITSTQTKRDGKASKLIIDSNLKPTRWIVERTFAWFNNYRRLSRDYERKPSHSEATIHLAMIQLMLRRLTQTEKPVRWISSA